MQTHVMQFSRLSFLSMYVILLDQAAQNKKVQSAILVEIFERPCQNEMLVPLCNYWMLTLI